MPEAHPEDGGAAGHGVADQCLGRAQPRVLGVVVGAHGAAEHDEPVVGEPLGHLLAEVAAHDVERQPRRLPPLAEPRRRGVRLVLHDEQTTGHQSWAPTSEPMA